MNFSTFQSMTYQQHSRDTLLFAAKGLSLAPFDGESVLLDEKSGLYFGLNEVGSRILDLVQEPTSVATLLETLHDEYEVSSGELENDLMEFLEDMIRQGIIVRITAAT